MSLKLEQLNGTATQKKKMLSSETVSTLTAQVCVYVHVMLWPVLFDGLCLYAHVLLWLRSC